MEKQGKIFILSGPSGSGKGTVLKSAMREHPDMFLSVSATTRGPRQGEIDGVHYHFIDDDAFLKMIDRDQLLEHAGYAGNFYGTPRIPVDEALDQGRDVMLEIDVQGAQQIYAKQNYEYPVEPGLEPSDAVKAFGTLKSDTLPLADIAKFRKQASEMVDRVGLDDGPAS